MKALSWAFKVWCGRTRCRFRRAVCRSRTGGVEHRAWRRSSERWCHVLACLISGSPERGQLANPERSLKDLIHAGQIVRTVIVNDSQPV